MCGIIGFGESPDKRPARPSADFRKDGQQPTSARILKKSDKCPILNR